MAALVRGPEFNLCLAQHLAESIGELKSEVVDITRGLCVLLARDFRLRRINPAK